MKMPTSTSNNERRAGNNDSMNIRISQRRLPALVAAMAVLVSQAAVAVTIDMRGTLGVYGGFGNTLQYSAGGISVDVFGWAETGSLQTSTPSNFWYFQTAEIYSFATGIGVCNRVEGSLGSGNCETNEREIDTAGSRDDLLVLYFDQTVNFSNLEVTVDPWDGTGSDPNDRDLRYWIASVPSAPDLSTFSFNTLSGTFGTSFLSSATSSYNAYTHLLSGVSGPMSGNLLMISGNWVNRNCTDSDITSDSECEAWKLKSVVVEPVSQVVPVPAAVWLLGSALGALGWMRRRTN
jgi:hypothetical protein